MGAADNIRPEMVMERYKTDDTFFYIGACSLSNDAHFSIFDVENLLVNFEFMDVWDKLSGSWDYKDPEHFLFDWWHGKIVPYTCHWDQEGEYYTYTNT